MIPIATRKILNLSINAGSYNPLGVAANPLVPIYARGSYMAAQMINEHSDILLNFHIDVFTFDCGASRFDAAYAEDCFNKDKDMFGLGMVAPYTSGMAIGALKTFQKLNLTFPVIGPTNSDTSLNSTVLYPLYTRVQISNQYLASEIPNIIKALG